MQTTLPFFKKSMLLLCCMIYGGILYAQVNSFTQQVPNAPQAAVYNEKLQQQSLLFIENRGQVGDAAGRPRQDILFTAKSRNVNLYISANSIHYQFSKTTYPAGYNSIKNTKGLDPTNMQALEQQIKHSTHRVTVELQGANPHPSVKKEQQSDYFENYYLANCPDGILGVKSYEKIIYENVYPGIDWVIYSNGGFLEYDFVVKEGADRSQIKLKIKDADEVSITANGELLIKTRLGEVTEKAPITFDTGGKEVKSRFIQYADGAIGFDVDAPADAALRIDPSVVWATYYGGSVRDGGVGCTVDGSGNVYMAGNTRSATGIASGGFQNAFGGGLDDAYLVKFNSGGTRLWATYYGGSGQDWGNSCAVDASGNIYMAGNTGSASGIASGGFLNTMTGSAASGTFLAKFNSGGTRLWATYYVGGIVFLSGLGPSCVVDGSNNVYLSGSTISDVGAAAFGGFQNIFGGGRCDAFLVKFSSTGVRLWATYYGGGESDYAFSCAIDGADNVYLCGSTESTNNIASGGFQNSFAGGLGDAFLVKFNNSGSRLWSTYYGGSDWDEAHTIAVDGSDNIYMACRVANSANLAYNGFQNTHGGGQFDNLLVKFGSSGTRLWATYYGGSGSEFGVISCAVDGSDNVYLAGSTNSTNNIACGGFKNFLSGAYGDACLVKFSADGARIWGTYYGGSNEEYSGAIAVAASGHVYMTGYTMSISGISSGGHQNTNGGDADAFLVKIEGSVIPDPALNLAPTAGILYVDKTKSGNGSSWANAAPELAHALKVAQINTSITQIWVAKGSYSPMHSPSVSATCPNYNDPNNAFLLVNNVKIYGGFSGNGTEIAISQRNIALYPTILSGLNFYHTVISTGPVGTAELNGFTIENGKANGTDDIIVNGETVFRNNGGGVYIINSSPRIENCIIKSNIATANGGGLYVARSSCTLSSIKISGNTASNGGGIYLDNAGPTLANCLLSGNKATGNGGGLFNSSFFLSPVFRNCTIASNRAVTEGGGLYFGGFPGTLPLVYNSIIYGNRKGISVSNFVTSGATPPEVRRSIIENNAGFTDVSNNLFGIGNNPLFVNPKDASQAPTNAGNYSVLKCSPAINTGNNTYISGYATDLAGYTRILNTTVDRGAYENNSAVSALPAGTGIVYVDKTKSGDGSSWENAVPELSDALFAARTNTAISAIWVAAGTYYPQYDIGFACVFADERDKTFVLVNNVRLYGGFAGGETALSQRNFALNETILSGDIGVQGDRTDNSYHVVVSSGDVGSALLNGFTIQDGQATGGATATINGINFSRNSCGGMYIVSSSPDVANCVVKNNFANAVAGGIYVSISNSTFTNCNISGNAALATGGGIYSSNPSASSTAYASFYHCTVSGNRGTSGAYFTTTGTEPAKMYNCIFYGNKTNAGIANSDIISSSSTTDDPEVYYSIVGNVASTTAYVSVGGNSTANPLFNYQEDALNAPTLAGNYRLQKCSPAINSGNNVYATATRDLDANTRIGYITVDKGAYEKYLALPDANGIVYVNSSNAENESDGSSWEKAVTELGDALKAAKFNTAIQQVWVAKGTYKPIWRADFTTNSITGCPNLTDKHNAFVLVPDVKIYGGFAGGEADTSGRDFVLNKTILSGDFSNDDVITGTGVTLSITNNTENAYHVIISADAVGTAAFDGFTVTKANAVSGLPITVNGGFINRSFSGGIYIRSSSPIISNCSIIGNSAILGGGMYLTEISSPTITNTAFTENLASAGGGIQNSSDATSVPTITNCSFTGNWANTGGGMYNGVSSPTIANCNFTGNFAANEAGGMYNINTLLTITNTSFIGNIASIAGGMQNASASPVISNCIFSGNIASNYAGGMLNVGFSSPAPAITNCSFIGNSAANQGGGMVNGSSSPLISNTTISGNFSGTNGGGMYNSSSIPIIKNSIVWGNNTGVTGPGTATISNSIIQGGYTGTNVYDLDPLFIAPENATNAPTIIGDYHLQPCSPALNIGNNADVSGILDLDNNTRIAYADVDLGAYEQQTNIYIEGKYSIWKGIDNNWHNRINWCGGNVPTSDIDATIPATSNNPILSATGETKNIVLNNTTTITTAAAGQLTINGTYTNSGSSIINNGTWVMAGNEINQTFPGTAATVSAMNNLEINNSNGITIDKSFAITGVLTPTVGNINISNNIITLRSTAAGTASVAVIQPAASISYTGTGQFEVERFINTGTIAGNGEHAKSWQFLATPVAGQTVFQSWQEAGLVPAGYGTWLTGTGTGFDATTVGPSMKYFNVVGNSYTGITNTASPLQNPLGYFLFVRGDRSVTTYNGTPNNTTMRSKGTIFSPANPPPSVTVTANKFQSFGNPYPSRIDFSSVLAASTGINDVFYAWDPKLSVLGGWQTITGLTGYLPTPGNVPGSYYPAGDAVPYIESGQAVFVHGDAVGGMLNFSEDCKAGGNRLVNRTATNRSAISNPQYLSTTLFTATGLLADGNIVVFDDALYNGFDNNDAVKRMNDGENFGLVTQDSVLAVEARSAIAANDTIFFYMKNLQQQAYQLRFAAVNITSMTEAFLIDKFTNSNTQLSLNDSSFVDFVVTNDPLSSQLDRFMIVFKMPTVVPVNFTDISATRYSESLIDVFWNVENELMINRYEIERSADGRAFIKVGTSNPSVNNGGSAAYIHHDEHPLDQDNFYRIKSVNESGSVQFSRIVKVSPVKPLPGIVAYPNPVVDGKIFLHFNDIPQSSCVLKITNDLGQLVFKKAFEHAPNQSVQVIDINKNLAHGNYRLEIFVTGELKIIQSVIF